MGNLQRLIISSGLSSALALLSFAGSAHALEDREWMVESHRGTVQVQTEGLRPIALTPNVRLGAGSTIETGDDGRIVLVRGDETIIVSPRTSLALPESNNSGMATTILQSFGTILLQVEKRAKQHFEVETPFLAAVVKGTKFTVTVEPAGAAVHVVEGAVQVIDLDTGDMGLVRPGQTAHSPAAQGVGLSVAGPGAVQPSRAAVEPRTNTAPVAPPAASESTAAAPSSAQFAARTVLAEPVGAPALDVAASTKGLVRVATVSQGVVSSQAGSVAPDENASARALGGQDNRLVAALAPRGLVDNMNAVANGISGGAGRGLSQSASGGAGNGVGATPIQSSALGGGNGVAVGLSGAMPSGLAGNPNANVGGNGNSNAGGSGNNGNGLAIGQSGALPPGLANNLNSNAGGNGNGNGNSNAGGTGNNGKGLAIGQSGVLPPGLANNPNSNAGGNGNGLATGQSGALPPGLANNPNSNAGGNGNGRGNGNGNGNGNG